MTSLSTTRPDGAEYSPAVGDYVRLVPAGDLVSILARQPEQLKSLIGDLSDEDSLVRHPPYTWSIRQVVGHLTDCERVFGYRAMRLARNDSTALPGFDENSFVAFADFDRCKLDDLVSEFSLARQSNVLMFGQLAPDAWLRRSVVNGHPMTVRAVACVMAGHAEHHLRILQERLSNTG